MINEGSIDMKYWVYLICIVLISGCNNIKKDNIQELIKNKADGCKANCPIIITQLTNFKWDKMYVFDAATAPDEISNAIGINYPYYREFSKSIVFLLKNKIVHYENNEDNIETATDGSVIFDYPDSLRHQSYTPNQAKFKAKLVSFNGGSYYLLYQF